MKKGIYIHAVNLEKIVHRYRYMTDGLVAGRGWQKRKKNKKKKIKGNEGFLFTEQKKINKDVNNFAQKNTKEGEGWDRERKKIWDGKTV